MDILEEKEAFEKLPEIKKRLDMKCVHFNGTWYATNPHMGNSFATASYLNGAWKAWQAAKAQAVPDTYTPIVLALEDVQSKIAKTSFLTMDGENENEVMAVDANELAAYIDELIEAQEPAK